MKTKILFVLTLLLLLGCSKDNSSNDPVDRLPAATTTGANTAGCLVNGQVLLPKGNGFGGPILSCFYQQDLDGFHLGLSISNKTNNILKTIRMSLNPNQLVENNTYSLVKRIDNGSSYTSNFGVYTIYSDTTSDNIFETNVLIIGEIKITKLNTTLRIISGTFWYDAINPQGEVVQVREGRFDMRYVN